MSSDNSGLDLSSAKVLMVDDTQANIDVLRKVLAPEGYKLSFATSGEKALKIVARALPDLILLDVMMPGMDGLETCAHLKADPATRNIPVIFITAKTDTEDLVEGFKAGAVDYIAKPFRQEEVCVRVRTHLQSQILMKQREALINGLRLSEERFRVLATWSPTGIFQTDNQGQYVYTNQKWQSIFGLDERQGLGDGWLQVVNHEDRAQVRERWEDSIAQRRNFHARFRVNAAEGRRWVDLRARVLLNEHDQGAEGFVGSAEDVTEQKLAEDSMLRAKEEAESAVQAKSEFLAGMTHELRTPLNAIIGYSEMLADSLGGGDGDSDSEDLSRITSAGKYLLSLINNVLDLSKVEAGKMTVYCTEFNVASLVQDVTATITPLVSKNLNNLELQGLDSAGMLCADETKLRQILFNLLSNACKFTHNGTITLSVRRGLEGDKEWVYFSVADTGIGMTPEQVNNLFQKYVQASASTSHNYGGTGLGLVLCQQFSQLMGGDVSVASTSGQGSCFTVKLPVQTPP